MLIIFHRFLYVLAANQTSVEVLSLNGPGQAQNVQTYDFSVAAIAAGVTMDKINLQGMAAYSKRW
jgi:hypothetical protein